ncbi:MAG: RNase H-like domain-containing protein [Candidatus Thiodiazotropha sp.]
MLLQSVLLGKAREIYTQLSVEQSSSYETVKELILKGYELVPEAYRQKFRNCRKEFNQTHVEFARTKEQLFDRWCSSKKIGTDHEKLRQLMLVEEFKRCINFDVKTFLDEKQVETLEDAARLADDYSLTHKVSFLSKPFPRKPTPSNLGPKPNPGNPSGTASPSNAPKPKLTGESKPQKPLSQIICNYCKQTGHLIADCLALKRKQQRQEGLKPTGLTSLRLKPQSCSRDDNISNEKISQSDSVMEIYEPFLSDGFVSLIGDFAHSTPIKILRDTGASQSLILADTLPFSEKTSSGTSALIQGVECGFVNVPLHNIYLFSDLVTGPVAVGIRPSLPFKGVHLLLGNDLAGDKVVVNPLVTDTPCIDQAPDPIEQEIPDLYPSCAVTRAMAKKAKESDDRSDFDLTDSFIGQSFRNEISKSLSSNLPETQTELNDSTLVSDHSSLILPDQGHDIKSRSQLSKEQHSDPEISPLFQKAISDVELAQDPICYYIKNGILMRKWRPPDVPADDEWTVNHQIVVPKIYRSEILSLAHETPLSGHLGVNKTYHKILNHFYWPGLRSDVSNYCRSCHTCQMVGKPNQVIPKAELQPIPAFDEPFSRIIIDCVGPLPRTKSGNEYLLTIMCASTRFPEAIPLRNIKTKTIVKALVKFFTFVGLPKSVQSDQGSNFMSGIFQQVMYELGIRQYRSSPYHPESQGALERFHQTLKTMIRSYCFDTEKDWDEGIHLLLFAVRESVQESLGFSPFELVFGHVVRGPLKLLKEKFLSQEDSPLNLLQYVSDFRNRLSKACEAARSNLKIAQDKMKLRYDENAKVRSFKPGDKVLALLPIPGRPLQARYFGPYTIEKKASELNYIINTPGRRKQKQLCHINMLKEYIDRESSTVASVTVSDTYSAKQEETDCEDMNFEKSDPGTAKLKNSDILKNLDQKLSHLEPTQRNELKDLIHEYEHLFPDIPTRTDKIYHDVIIADSEPVKQHPYRMNPTKQEYLKEEIQYLLDNDFIEPSKSAWSSPCILVPKPDGTYRMCTDFRKINLLTKTDSFPMARIDDCIDNIGHAKYVTKFDLLKGFWQIPLTDRAKEVSAFVTPDGLYQYKVMPFGMKNSPATFQRLVNMIIAGLDGCKAYIDDAIIYSDTWDKHLGIIRDFFDRLSEAKLTINLDKSEFCHAHVTFLGHVVGQGKVTPVDAKVQVINDFPIPTSKRQLMRFLGMAGYYRKFCNNFSVIAQPLTNLLSKRTKFLWNEECQNAFEKLKAILNSAPVLLAPNFQKAFKLAVDASDIGAGGVLLQEDDNGVDHPISYFSKKFNKHQRNYSTIEKECLSLILALQHFEVYLTSTSPIVVFSDHNPLTFIHKMKNKNQRLLRWSLLLQEYNLEIRHVRGRDNVIPDALSRL